ncbi:hypothetical protein COCC4DRAFT_66784 [Bipolaris maydis ATCC 48331]|uniref:Uncharacterized protein n=2 Tax=Cochliobolus heterostrophus TaxID=5016 RepID=M2TV10_COCH5|nr:uncharacterized protein COCC4DRAFT_66784 [Bipolaris maydis ATCC 48331]EMD84784.1 hypothetical protein COCHEDRAFT_1121448 [Bipolaris maydis C5]EMD85601.1 hypothetical protein COCHEDRAFT_1117959 [Bipolaris maydis C5]ENH99038.1 hypothetical protein COCC4DRAFT_66784 [Bipolaris maydis ATCC 48331]
MSAIDRKLCLSSQSRMRSGFYSSLTCYANGDAEPPAGCLLTSAPCLSHYNNATLQALRTCYAWRSNMDP